MYNRAIYTHINVGICTHTGSHCAVCVRGLATGLVQLVEIQ